MGEFCAPSGAASQRSGPFPVSPYLIINSHPMTKRVAIIIGAGPAGLTAAHELLQRTDIQPLLLEKSTYMGGISRTVQYKGNRIDIGGHRFFSKSDRVMQWWLQHLPLETSDAGQAAGQNGDAVMLVRSRRSRIYYLRKFFDYPVQLNGTTLGNLGLARVARIGCSYLRTILFPPRHIENLEDFFISRFGRELYRTFFESYTEKVWGIPCRRISAEWGSQRIKGLSITKALIHFLKGLLPAKSDVRQKNTETSLIEQFLYPKLGPGQLWEAVAEKVKARGGTIVTGFSVDSLRVNGGRVVAVSGRDGDGRRQEFAADFVFSTMPIVELIRSLDAGPPARIREISEGLQYRDFITVGLLLKKLELKDPASPQRLIKDNWIYIQEPDVLVGRLQIFNNWSPHLVRDPATVWIGAEYFCAETDELWKLSDEKMAALAIQELAQIGVLREADVLDSTVLRMPKTYPAYFGAYDRIGEIQEYLERFVNLFPVGRNGMHRYNNQDHSMLTAMAAVDNICAGRTDKTNIWAINTEEGYHEEKDAKSS